MDLATKFGLYAISGYLLLTVFMFFLKRRLLYYPNPEAPSGSTLRLVGLDRWPEKGMLSGAMRLSDHVSDLHKTFDPHNHCHCDDLGNVPANTNAIVRELLAIRTLKKLQDFDN